MPFMAPPAFGNLTADALKTFLATVNENQFELIDVREPAEYQQAHIPGARHIPLGQVEDALPGLDRGREYVFYCRSGNRSRQACRIAALIAPGLAIRNLEGGMLAWDGAAVPDVPRVELFADAANMREMLLLAMDLEKAAHDLYATLARDAGPPAVCGLMDKLVGLEKAHAMVLYKLMRTTWGDLPMPPFEAMFAALPGKVLEGGKGVEDLGPWIAKARTGDCMAFAELALEVEANAQDLYRALARNATNADLAHTFLDLAQQEKGHSRVIMDSLSLIAENG
ncbi:MAG: rhodanese-like domain-containing protein [Desulfovibrionaceae bacterium]